MNIIYALINPINQVPFYVGATKRNLEDRLAEHLQIAKRRKLTGKPGEKQDVILKILSLGFKPEIKALVAASDDITNDFEKAGYSILKKLGYRLDQSPDAFYKVDPKARGRATKVSTLQSSVKDDDAITEKNKELIVHIANGRTVPEIAKLIFRSPRTIETQIRILKDSLGAKTLPHLITIAFKLGYLS